MFTECVSSVMNEMFQESIQLGREGKTFWRPALENINHKSA